MVIEIKRWPFEALGLIMLIASIPQIEKGQALDMLCSEKAVDEFYPHISNLSAFFHVLEAITFHSDPHKPILSILHANM